MPEPQRFIDPITGATIRTNERLPIPLEQRQLIVDIIKDACEITGKAAIEAYKKSEQFLEDAAEECRQQGWAEPA